MITQEKKLKKQERKELDVDILVSEVKKEVRVEKGFFSDRLTDEINVFLEIQYRPGIQTLLGLDGQKPKIGYEYWYEISIDPDGMLGTETRRCRRSTLRPCYRIDKKMYQLVLNPHDDFFNISNNLARILVESQGKTGIRDENRVREEPNLSISYRNNELEKILKRI